MGQGHPIGNHSNNTPNGYSNNSNATLAMAGTVPQEGWEWPCHHSFAGGSGSVHNREWLCVLHPFQ